MEAADPRRAPSTVGLVDILEDYWEHMERLWELHFEVVFPAYVAVSEFADLYRDLFGGEAFDAYRLLHGTPDADLRGRLRPLAPEPARAALARRRRRARHARRGRRAGRARGAPRRPRGPDPARPPPRGLRPSHRELGPRDAELHRGPDAGPEDAQGLRHAARRRQPGGRARASGPRARRGRRRGARAPCRVSRARRRAVRGAARGRPDRPAPHRGPRLLHRCVRRQPGPRAALGDGRQARRRRACSTTARTS